MATVATTSATIDRPPQSYRRSSPRPTARRIALVAVAAGAAISIVATARLAAVVLATPPDIWLEEVPRLVNLPSTSDPGLSAKAASTAAVISDPALISAQLGACDGQPVADTDACVAVIDTALKAAPAAGELWFFKSAVLARQGEFSDRLLDALRNSYRVAARESWIAADRVVLGLQLYPLLPTDLQANVAADLAMVIDLDAASRPLVAAYAVDERLRESAAPLLQALPAVSIQRFVSRVRRAIRSP